MRVLHTHNRSVKSSDPSDPSRETWLLTECPNCRGVCLLYGDWSDGLVDAAREAGFNTDEFIEVVYPSAVAKPRGLPKDIRKALSAAERVRLIDANAYGVLLGRLLELVCTDRGAPKGKLFARLQHLEGAGEIPPKLVKVAHGLRDLRNAGAHPDLGELTEKEVGLLADLARAILEYVYTAPHLANKAARALASIKGNQGRSSKRT